MPNPKDKPQRSYVVVATAPPNWSVVAGWLVSETITPAGVIVEIADARMIVHFSADAKSLYGIAHHGPGNSARVSPRVDSCKIVVQQVLKATEKARKEIEKEPWS